jgi:hypothetical protein
MAETLLQYSSEALPELLSGIEEKAGDTGSGESQRPSHASRMIRFSCRALNQLVSQVASLPQYRLTSPLLRDSSVADWIRLSAPSVMHPITFMIVTFTSLHPISWFLSLIFSKITQVKSALFPEVLLLAVKASVCRRVMYKPLF